MTQSKSRFLLFLLVCGSLFSFQLSPAAQGPAREDTRLEMAIEASLRQASKEANTSPVNSSLRLATARTVQMDDLAFEAYAVKVLDSDNDVIYRYWYDEDIQAIAEAIAFRARAAAYEARYGRLSRSLYERINELGLRAETEIPVAIWAEQPVGTDVVISPRPYRVFLPLVVGGHVALISPGASDRYQWFVFCIRCIVGESRGQWARQIPDVENIPKLIVDAFTGVLYHDDNLNHVRGVQVEVGWGPDDQERAEVWIFGLPKQGANSSSGA